MVSRKVLGDFCRDGRVFGVLFGKQKRGNMTTVDTAKGTSRFDTKEFPARYRYYVLAIIFITAVFNFIDRQILAILQEPIKNEFGLDDAQVGSLSLVFTIFYVGLALPLARLADTTVRRTMLAICLSVWSFMTALCGVAQNFWQLSVARAGVGAGEAGGAPICHSMIADYFPPENRATALSVYAMGVPVGIMLGLVIGGVVAENFGWRMAFLVVGLPGLLLALVIFFTVREPPRGLSENLVDTGEAPKLTEVFSYLWQLNSFRHLAVAAGLQAMVAYGTFQWLPAFLVRVHGFSVQDVGLTVGPLLGIAGLIGTIGSGLLADRLARQDQRWYLWMCALSMAIATPFAIAAFLAGSATFALALYFIPMILGNTFIGVTGAVVQGLAPVRMRALAAATKTMVLNLIGLGLGPFIIGFLSDTFNQGDSGEGLRYAMLWLVTINLWSAIHYMIGARSLREDLDRTAAQSETASTGTVPSSAFLKDGKAVSPSSTGPTPKDGKPEKKD